MAISRVQGPGCGQHLPRGAMSLTEERGRFKRQSVEGRTQRTPKREAKRKLCRHTDAKEDHGHKMMTEGPSHRAFRRSTTPPAPDTSGLRPPGLVSVCGSWFQ